MTNLVRDSKKREFYVWIDENNFLTKHNIEQTGFLTSIPVEENKEILPYIENPNKSGFMSPFLYNIVDSYRTEYNLELSRKAYFPDYPPRLIALFLFDTLDDAIKYRKNHLWHIQDRTLKRVETYDEYTFSKHDLGWTDFLLQPGGQDSTLVKDVTEEYWKGTSIKGKKLIKMGRPYLPISNNEILYLGWVKPKETIPIDYDS